MHKFVGVLDKYGWGGGGDMYVPFLNFAYGHFPFWGVGHVPLPGWYLPMLQFHLALCCFFMQGHVAKKCVIIGCTCVWSSSEILAVKLINNNYSSNLNGLWVNNPWGWRPNRLLTQRPWGQEVIFLVKSNWLVKNIKTKQLKLVKAWLQSFLLPKAGAFC